MSSGVYSLLGALGGLVLGLVEVAVFQRYIYPVMRRQHETAKLTASQHADPSRYVMIVRLQSLVILPVIGFMLGDRLKSIFG